MEWDIKTLDQKKEFHWDFSWPLVCGSLDSEIKTKVGVGDAKIWKNRGECAQPEGSGLVALWPAMVNVSHEIAMVCESVSNPGRLG